MKLWYGPILMVLTLCHCGAPRPPQCHGVPRESRQPASQLVGEARGAWDLLASSAHRSEWPAAQARYNSSVAKLFDQLRCPARPWDEAASALGTRILPAGPDDIPVSGRQILFPADLIDTRNVGERQTTGGLGVPIVGWSPQPPENRNRDPFAPPTGLPLNITALLRFDRGDRPAWQFCGPFQKAETTVAHRRVPLAADWSAGHAFYWHMSDLDDFDVAKVLDPARFSGETGLYFAQPYDPDRIPVVFIHGINSSPAAFRHMLNRLIAEEWFRKKYQIWLFSYPTGNPWLLSAGRFRSSMNAAAKYARQHGDHGNLGKTVIVAHSMGGLITRASLSEPGTCFYDCFFKKPIDRIHLTPRARERIRDDLLYRPLDFPDRVIFLAVPHQGSPLAERRIFTWLSRLVRLPKAFTKEVLDIVTLNAGSISLDPRAIPTAIDNLSTTDPGIRALQHTRMPVRIHRHSIIGDRGRGDTPHSSDGIVPYWSSHITPVESEKIVPSDHGVPDNPEAAEEVIRILRIHAGLNRTAPP